MSSSSPASQFGPNEWLIEEMYEQFLHDPTSVDSAWHEFFADYKPGQATETTAAATGSAAAPKATATAARVVETNGQTPPPSATAPSKPKPAEPKPSPQEAADRKSVV